GGNLHNEPHRLAAHRKLRNVFKLLHLQPSAAPFATSAAREILDGAAAHMVLLGLIVAYYTKFRGS
ncbi:MAG: hypothetical protein K6G94_02845, partial [Kiritimatiellae bacterium]|nr:hypothetical protein [Kiritimatiellia bacterium]